MKTLTYIVITALLLTAPARLRAGAESIAQLEIQDLSADLQEYLDAAKTLTADADRAYLSALGVHNIYKQRALWTSVQPRDETLGKVYSESLTKFIFLHYYLDDPNWTDWGLLQLETFHPSSTAYIDTSTDLTYGACLSFVKKNWLAGFAQCNAFNELVGPQLLDQNPVLLEVRSGTTDAEGLYVIRAAEEYINHWLNESKEWFTFFLPDGEYQLVDQKSQIFPKEFTATSDSAQFVYLTPNFSFDFLPIAKIFTDTGVFYDTLGPQEFELVRINEGRLAVFDSLEYGRYLFSVKPPYRIVDKFPNKLILPKEAFGTDYMDRQSAMFDKHAYDRITVGNRQRYVYNKIEWVRTSVPSASETPGDSQR